MERLLKHKLVIGLMAVLVVASGGAAYAATQTASSPQEPLLTDVAKRLNVSPAKLRAAVQGALLDRVQAAVKAGELTQAQANRLKQRIEKGALPFGPLAGGGFWFHGPGPVGAPGAPGPLKPIRGLGPPGPALIFGPLAAAAKYLGLSDSQLLSDLRGGRTLARVAQSRGKSVSGLEQAIVASLTSRLDRLVALGYLTKAQEQRRLSFLTQGIDRLVEHGRVEVAPLGKPLGRAHSIRPVIPPGLFGGGPGVPPPPAP